MKNFLLILSFSLITLTACKKEVGPGSSTPDMSNKDFNSSMVSAYASYRMIAGASGQSGFTNGNGNKARFNFPLGIWVNKDGSLLVSDMSNNAIRKLTSDTIVSTLNIPKTVDNESLSVPHALSVAADGTVGITNSEGIWFYKPGNNTLSHYVTNFHESINDIDINPAGNYFWFANTYKLGYTNGNQVLEAKYAVTDTSDEPLVAFSSCANGKKYVATYQNIYSLNADASHTHLFQNIAFKGLQDIVASKDGSKIYFIENGDIKMIENCTRCTIKKTTLAIRTKASYLALANSERFLYFTSSYYNTVNKLTL